MKVGGAAGDVSGHVPVGPERPVTLRVPIWVQCPLKVTDLMTARSVLMEKPPAPVAEALMKLGANLKTGGLRRNFSEQDVAKKKIGVSRKVVGDAEKGKPSTDAAMCVAMLWAMGLDGPVANLADPLKDDVDRVGALLSKRTRAGKTGGEFGTYSRAEVEVRRGRSRRLRLLARIAGSATDGVRGIGEEPEADRRSNP